MSNETVSPERELGSEVTACPTCGEPLKVSGTDEAGATLLVAHDHDEAQVVETERAEASMPPRETGTDVTPTDA